MTDTEMLLLFQMVLKRMMQSLPRKKAKIAKMSQTRFLVKKQLPLEVLLNMKILIYP